MIKVTKAILPVAGFGTRFLPATKAQPKEMLPIVDKPAIQYLVEDAVRAGIKEVVFVTGRGKRAIEDHFDISYELEKILEERNKPELLSCVRAVSEMVHLAYIRQKAALGLGHAISIARDLMNEEPFAVLLGDDVIVSEVPCMRQMMDVYDKYQTSVVALMEVSEEETSRYGIIKGLPMPGSGAEVVAVESAATIPCDDVWHTETQRPKPALPARRGGPEQPAGRGTCRDLGACVSAQAGSLDGAAPRGRAGLPHWHSPPRNSPAKPSNFLGQRMALVPGLRARAAACLLHGARASGWRADGDSLSAPDHGPARATRTDFRGSLSSPARHCAGRKRSLIAHPSVLDRR